MINLQLYILNDEGTSYDEVELYDNETVSYTQSLQDIKDIQKVFSDFTRTFNVPASRQNNKVFKHFYNYFIDGFNPKRRHKAKIFLNYKLYQEGYIKMEGATTKDNAPFTYRITFFGKGVVLKDVLKDTKLSNLGLLVEAFTLDYNSTNVRNLTQSGLDVTFQIPKSRASNDEPDEGQYETEEVEIKEAIVFPVISHTKRFIYNSAGGSGFTNNESQNNIANVVDSGDNKYGLELTQLKPAIRVHAIIKAIEEQFKREGIEFSTDFFNTTNRPYYNLYMWLHTKTGQLFSDQDDEVFFTGFKVTDKKKVPLSGVDFGVGIVSNNQFEIPIPTQSNRRKNHKRDARLIVETTSTNEMTLVVRKDGNIFQEYTGTATSGEFVAVKGLELPHGIYQFSIKSIDVVDFKLKVLSKRLGKSGGEKSFVKFEGNASVGTDKKIYPASQMPDMKILDFLTGLFKLFNLTAFQGDDGKIKVQTLDQFFSSSSTIHDITEHIDKNSVTIDSVVPYRQVNFKYKGLNSFLAKTHEDLFNIEWGGLHYEENEGNLGTEYKIEVPFEHFKYEKLYDVNDNTDTGVLFGWSVDEKQEPNKGEPLLFYPVKTPLKKDIKYKNFDGTSTTLLPGLNLIVPSNSVDVGDDLLDSDNLNFNAEINEYSEIPFASSIFEKYYKNYITEIFDPQRRITYTQAYLPLRILLNLKLNDRIQITDRQFKINKLTTDFQRLLTKFELINTNTVAGKQIITETESRPGEVVTDIECPTADSDTFFADDSIITVDCTNSKALDGYVFINNSGDGTTAEHNTPDTSVSGEPVEVTPPVIFDAHLTADMDTIYADSDLYTADVNLREVTASSFKIGYQITEHGKIGTKNNLDEYGFLWSTTEADLEGTDIDDIAAVSGVTQIRYASFETKTYPMPKNVIYEKGLLSSATTYYFRFYARTNTNIAYAEADVISEIEEVTTL